MHRLLSTCAALKLVTAAFVATWLVACSGKSDIPSTASYNPGYGPFDQNGDYVEAWADKPARKHTWGTKPAPPKPVGRQINRKDLPLVVSRNKPATKPPALLASQAPPSRPEPTVQPQPPRPTPPKPAPSPTIRHTVIKGDTLYSLGRRYGTSVGAIQRANGIRGTIIRIGQKLKIPR
ncbi:MAG: LysM peptidoglycan-binding domain-containing protein [Roseibacillus sp.]|nr:LysM peptidoglycan-binding domain-containing protein [Roseibacillus sp.]